MSELKTLVDEVRAAKKAYEEYKEEECTTCDSIRYKEITAPSYRKPLINRVYRAVNALNAYMFAETGADVYAFRDLTVSYGYMGNPDAE